MNRHLLRAGLSCCAVALPLLAQSDEKTSTPEPPNIVFILADDLGWGDLGCYGQSLVPTPSLDRLAAEGMRFTQFYAGSTVCAPSRCALMTGLHTGHCRIRGNRKMDLLPEDVTLAEQLKAAGYATAMIGKWGLGTPGGTGVPTRQGFDTFFGFLDQTRAHNYFPAWLWRGEEKEYLANEGEAGVASKRVQYSHDLFTEEALRVIQASRAPFFLYLAYTVPHANNELAQTTGNGMEVPDYGPYAAEDWDAPARGRAAMLHRLDQDVGRLVAAVDRLGMGRSTLIVFSSDNGPHREGGSDPDFFAASGGLRGIKRALYEGGIRVPMIARWPGTIAPKSTSDRPCALWDVMPTLLAAAGAKTPEGIDGQSFLPTLRGRRQAPARFLYWEFHERGFHQAVRSGRWKAVRHGRDAPLELYDLDADRAEDRDVAARHADVVEEIEAWLKTARIDSEAFPVK